MSSHRKKGGKREMIPRNVLGQREAGTELPSVRKKRIRCSNTTNEHEEREKGRERGGGEEATISILNRTWRGTGDNSLDGGGQRMEELIYL